MSRSQWIIVGAVVVALVAAAVVIWFPPVVPI